MLLPNVGDVAVEDTLRYALETMEVADRPGSDKAFRSTALHNLAFAVWHSGDCERAEGLNRLAARVTSMTVNSGMAFLQAGVFAGEQAAAERAAVLYGAGDTHFMMEKAPFYERQLRPGAESSKQALGEDRYQELHTKGAAMSLGEATAFLLDV